MSLILGDCIEEMAKLPEASVDAVVTDPPYGLGFMGKDWDSPGGTGDFPMRRTDATNTVNTGAARQGGRQRSTEDFAKRQARDARSYQAWCETWAREALRVLKPGGFILSLGGARTYHRLACGIEDAGFEIRDEIATLLWLYGSGFPKSLNIGEGRGTALKPAHEPICVARKSLEGTVVANVAEHGTGALNIDGCRVATSDALGGGSESENWRRKESNEGWKRPWMEDPEAVAAHAERIRENVARAEDLGRWPANVVLDEASAEMLDEQTGVLKSGKLGRVETPKQNAVYGKFAAANLTEFEANEGGASRFFYVAKASRAERNAGLERFETLKSSNEGYGTIQQPKLDRAAPRENRTPHATANHHPTVKPIALMRWLVRLVTPPGGTVLDPFVGSGTTGIAAALEDFGFVGIEREPDYLAIAQARIEYWRSQPTQLDLLGEAVA